MRKRGLPRKRLAGGQSDKAARCEIFLEGALAECFRAGVEALMREDERTPEAFDDYIAGFSGLAQHPLSMH